MEYFVFGNWKSNGRLADLKKFQTGFSQFAPALPSGVHTGFAFPFHMIESTTGLGAPMIGAQNVSRYDEGAYTGEITAGMLAELGSQFALVGHSERRALFGETVADTAEKLQRLLAANILPVLCIGETLEERQGGKLEAVLSEQLTALDSVEKGTRLVVAYEPVWAIGTGVAAKPEDVAETHAFLAKHLESKGFGGTPLQYGGSVKPENAKELAGIAHVDGFLVGGASLKADQFAAILSAFIEGKA